MAPPRNWGLPWHMLYPAIAFILITIPTFTSSQSIWLVSANTSTKQIRFGPQDFCGFNRTHGAGTDVYRALGCVYGGTSYTVAKEDLDIVLPSSISYSLSKCAALLYLGFALLILAVVNQGYTTYYSYKESPDKDKCLTLVAIHYLLALTTTISLIITTFVLLIVCGVSVNNNDIKRQGTAIWWGQSVWMVLAAAVVTLLWSYEAVRWRRASLAD